MLTQNKDQIIKYVEILKPTYIQQPWYQPQQIPRIKKMIEKVDAEGRVIERITEYEYVDAPQPISPIQVWYSTSGTGGQVGNNNCTGR